MEDRPLRISQEAGEVRSRRALYCFAGTQLHGVSRRVASVDESACSSNSPSEVAGHSLRDPVKFGNSGRVEHKVFCKQYFALPGDTAHKRQGAGRATPVSIGAANRLDSIGTG
eukprot:CAMPEP_0174872886 /NCGR_PEP_ID=MMETSP1114-20130205/73998_1 /TAXON_ID=312471 /ORGANISM="Neobodo designis, Strain CCAP 1951/1" /LENGTH=112 /DNA_ID=CAMNT_0016108197 /DNA_START=239 /DNA_END=573 /DNA_ORIENTATION=+